MTHSSSRSKWKRGFDGAEWRQLQSPALSVAVRVTRGQVPVLAMTSR